jgi:hypothetical protein
VVVAGVPLFMDSLWLLDADLTSRRRTLGGRSAAASRMDLFATLDALFTPPAPMLEWMAATSAADRQLRCAPWASVSRTDERQGLVLDVVFVAVTLVFFVVSLGYVGLCDRLMK